jgi:hypothetical protein
MTTTTAMRNKAQEVRLMLIDLRGRVSNVRLGASSCLQPLFEAIVNSIDAIDESGGHGQIDVYIDREPAPGVIKTEEGPWRAPPICGFTVVDSGVGFTDENYHSFQTSDTTQKVKRGGKGVGRLLWLKAFSKASVESVYEKDGRRRRRTFDFTLSQAGIEGVSDEEANGTERKTSVRLTGFFPTYREECPKGAGPIARRIIEHCLEYFVMETCPAIYLHDPEGREEPKHLQALFAEEVKPEAGRRTFEAKGQTFQLHHVRLTSAQGREHRLFFCAHRRAVCSEKLVSRIPNLQVAIRDVAGRPFLYAGYVSGPYLDERVDAERTSFNIPDGASLPFKSEVGWDDLVSGAVGAVEQYLHSFLAPVEAAKDRQIREYIERVAPQYRHLLKHRKEALKAIPPNLPSEELEMALHRIDRQYEVELKDRAKKVLEEEDTLELRGLKEHQERFSKVLEEWNEAGAGSWRSTSSTAKRSCPSWPSG